MEDGNAIEENRKCIKTSVTFEPQCNGCDYLSQLSDEILIFILDKLRMEDAWPTCILAKSWKNLWRYKTDVVFMVIGLREQGIMFLVLLNVLCTVIGVKRSRFQRLSVSLRYNTYMRDSVNNWIMSAFEKNVEEICIDLNGIEKKSKWRKHSDFCLLPDCEIECSTLVKLTFTFMTLQMLPTCLTAIKELYLEEVELAADAVEKITSICSSLTLISLSNCNIKSDLKIRISVNCSLLKLIINEELGKVRKSKKLYLHAPSITTIEFASALPRKTYHVEDLPMVDQVKFSLDKMSHDPEAVIVIPCDSLFGRRYYDNFKLFSVFKSANVVFLSSWCVQILALENKFYYILYTFGASHLVLEMGLSRRDLGGLVYMLNACDALKRLPIVITKAVEFTFQYIDCMKGFEGTNSPYYRDTEDLPTLEVVEFKNNCANFEHDLRANGCFCFDEARFLNRTECGLMALSLLKSKAKNLRSLVFESRKCRCETDLQNGTYSYSSRK